MIKRKSYNGYLIQQVARFMLKTPVQVLGHQAFGFRGRSRESIGYDIKDRGRLP